MLPKNSKHFIAPTAELLNIDVELAEDVISFYYSTVYKKLDTLSTTFLQIEELGSFTPNHKRILHHIAKNESLLTELNKTYSGQSPIKKRIEERIKELRAMNRKLCDINTARTEHRQNKLKNGHLEEPKAYLRRDK